MPNDMRDRLIDLTMDFAFVCPQNCSKEISCNLCKHRQLADYLIENGVILPPCKVGDTVYSFCDVFGAMLPYVIQDFKIGFLGNDKPNYWYWEATSHATETDELLDEIDFDLDDIGKTVFLTKEDAEKALKERGSDG